MSSLPEKLSQLTVKNRSLFENLKFCLVDLPKEKNDHVKRFLVDGGARQMSYMSDMVTHVIADDDDSADVSEAREIFEKPIINSSWVIMSVKCNFLLPIEGFSPDSKQIFSSVVACPSMLSAKDCQTLWGIFTFYGGKFKLKLDKSVTHLIATSQEGKKYARALSQGIKIVTPDWAVDSVNNKAKCDEELYHTKLLILPKSPTPSPPPAPPLPPPVCTPVQPSPVRVMVTQGIISPTQVSQISQQSTISTVASRIPQSVASVQPQTSVGMPQKIVWKERMPLTQLSPQQQQMAAGVTSTPEGIRTTMNWQHRPPQTILTSTASGTNPRASLWQQHLVTQGRLTQQQQMILQQKWAHQQSVNRQAVVQRLQAPNQQIQLTQQQRLQLSNQQIQISQGQPVITQQQLQIRKPHPNQQMPLIHKRLPVPNQQIQISQAQMQQLSNQLNSQGQISPNQQLQLAQMRNGQITNVQMNLHLQQQASQRMQLVQRQAAPPQQVNINEQTQLNQQKNVPLYQLVSQQQTSGQINQQPQQIPGQLNQSQQLASQLSGSQTKVHGQINQQPPVTSQIPHQHQVTGQIPQQPQATGQISQQSQVTGQIPQQPQIPTQVAQQPQIPTQVGQQSQILKQVSQQPPVVSQVSQSQAVRQLNTPQKQQILWQQQRPQGRVVIQQGGQPVQGIRQVPFDVQQQGQNPRLQQGLWQQKQMILAANQQRQAANRMQLIPGQQRMVSQQNVPPHPPPPYPGKSNQPTEQPQAFREVTQQQQQPSPIVGQQIINVNGAGQIVTPKTKTALANLLNTRLQTGNVSPNSKEPIENVPIQAPARAENVRKKDQATESTAPMKPTIQLYGHDLDITVPSNSCLIGCTICILDYEPPVNKVDVWKKIISHHGGEIEAKYSPQCTHIICESTKNPTMQQALRESKRCITAFWLNDVIIQKSMVPPWKALHIPSPCIHDKPCKKQLIATSGFDEKDRKCLQEMIQITGARYTGHLCQSNTLLIAKKNEGQKFKKATEWRIPVVNTQWLNDILFGHYEALRSPLAQKYQNFNLDNAFKLDYTNIHHLMFAWRSPVKVTETMLRKCVERPPLRTVNSVRTAQPNHKLEPPSKRIRLTSESGHIVGPKPRVMFSGITDVTELTNIVTRLGGSIAVSAKDCTHLVMKAIVRTVKLFTCISTCEFILSVDWLLESKKQNKFLEEELFIPDNPQAEAELGFNIKNTLKRKDRALILKGFTFYVTPSVPPSYNVLCLIIESAGGKIVKKALKLNEIRATNRSSVKYVIIGTEADLHLCKRFINNGVDVYNPEVVLTGVMNQTFDLETFKYKLETDASGHRMYC